MASAGANKILLSFSLSLSVYRGANDILSHSFCFGLSLSPAQLPYSLAPSVLFLEKNSERKFECDAVTEQTFPMTHVESRKHALNYVECAARTNDVAAKQGGSCWPVVAHETAERRAAAQRSTTVSPVPPFPLNPSCSSRTSLRCSAATAAAAAAATAAAVAATALSVRSFIRSFVRSLACSLIRSFVRLFVRSFASNTMHPSAQSDHYHRRRLVFCSSLFGFCHVLCWSQLANLLMFVL